MLTLAVQRCGADDSDVLGSAAYGLAFAYDSGHGGVLRQPKLAAVWVGRAAAAGNLQALALRRQQRWRWRSQRCFDLLLVICFLLVATLISTVLDLFNAVALTEAWADEVDGSDAEAVPAFEWTRNVYPGETSAALTRGGFRLIEEERLRSERANLQPLSSSFSGTRGVVIHFTRPALDDALAFGGRLRWLRDEFIAPLLDDRCNAFVFNILVVSPGKENHTSMGVQSHVDQTLIQSTTLRDQTAYKVSIGYVQVPRGIVGGELILGRLRHYPHEGSVLTFRGDQSHAVTAFCVTDDPDRDPTLQEKSVECDRDDDPAMARVSFVLEHYRLPPEKLKRSPSFLFAPSSKEQNYLPVLVSLPFATYFVDAYLWLRRRQADRESEFEES